MAGSENKVVSVPCNLCGSGKVEELSLTGRERKHLRTVICRECGLVWSDPLPIETKKYYEKDYRLEYKGVFEPKLKHIYRAGMVALNRFRKIERLLFNEAKVLDVGSGGGEFIYLLSGLGYKATGIEPNIGYAEYSKREYGLNVITGFVQDASIPANSYDLITIWHVLEHTDNPFRVLCCLNTWLRDKGVLIVEVPNVEAVCQSPANRFHFAHLYNFNLKTLEKMGNKAGFSSISHDVSKDGGNIFMVFRKDATHTAHEDFKIPGNAMKIIETLRKHTALSHYLSGYPYARFFRKTEKVINEKRAKKGFSKGREILDYYYKELKA